MSHVAVDYQSQASNAVRSKAGRQTYAQPKAPTGQFDDLLNAIPDAPAEPQPRARADAPDREPPAATRPAHRGNHQDRADRAPRTDARTGDDRPAAAADAPSHAAGAAPADKPAGDAAPAGADDTAKADTDAQTTDSPTADASAATTDAAAALVPPAVTIDPAAAATIAATDPTAEGEKTARGGAKPEIATAATHPSIKAAEQQAAALTDQSTGLSADDAEVLSALAVKAEQGLKNAQGTKTAEKKSTDKPAQPQSVDGDAAATAQSSQPAQADSGDAKTAEARPVQSELAKVAAEHQRGKADTEAKPAEHTAQGIGVAAVTAKSDGLPIQNFSAVLHQTHASSAAAGPSSASNGDKAVSIANVPVEISAKIAAGKNSFDIRLDPEELGRIHVKVSVDRDGNITTHMMADRPDTLDLLRRDTQGLERALQDAGLKTSDNSMQFSLRDQAQQQQQNQQDGQAGRRVVADEDLTATVTTTVIARDYGRYMQRPSGVDIRV